MNYRTILYGRSSSVTFCSVWGSSRGALDPNINWPIQLCWRVLYILYGPRTWNRLPPVLRLAESNVGVA